MTKNFFEHKTRSNWELIELLDMEAKIEAKALLSVKNEGNFWIDNSKVFIRNAVLAGLNSSFTLSDVRLSTLRYADIDSEILKLAHMYNAFLKEGLIKIEWPDMECLLASYDERYMFVGCRPQNVKRYYSHLELALGKNIQGLQKEEQT